MGTGTGGKISADGAPTPQTFNQQGVPSNQDPFQAYGVNGVKTHSATSGQPTIGAANQYANTIGQWDNTQQQLQAPMQGKGKGA